VFVSSFIRDFTGVSDDNWSRDSAVRSLRKGHLAQGKCIFLNDRTAFDAFLETIFRDSVSGIVAFAFSEHFSIAETGKYRAMSSSWNMPDASKLSNCASLYTGRIPTKNRQNHVCVYKLLNYAMTSGTHSRIKYDRLFFIKYLQSVCLCVHSPLLLGNGSLNTFQMAMHFFNPLLFASCTNTFSKRCEITTGMKRSAQ
jgi:hypothetical protein